VVSSLGRVVAIVEAPGIGTLLRALARHLRRRHAVRGSWTAAVRLFHLLTLLVVHGRLCIRVVILLPLAVSFRWSSRRPVVTLAGCLLSSRLGRSWWRSSASNTTGCRRISMVLVRSLVSVAWRSRSVLNDRAHFRRWAGRANTVWRYAALARGLRWWATETCRWGRGWRRHTTSVRTVVRVGDTVRLRWLLLLM